LTIPSNIKLLFSVLLLFALTANSQNEKEKFAEKRFLGSAYVSSYSLFPVGDNFANEGLEIDDSGVQFGFEWYLFKKFIVGGDFRFIRSENINRPLLGNYNGTNINSFNFKVGYRHLINEQFNVSITGGVGPVIYRSTAPRGERFRDSGTSYEFVGDFTYNFISFIGVFIQGGFRLDDLNIDAPSAIDSNFGGASYFRVSAGVKFTFVNRLYQWELDEEQREREEDARKDREADERARQRRIKKDSNKG